MTEDEALFLTAVANPEEHTPRLVLADWFDEHDEPALARALREEAEAIAFLAELTRWDRVPARPVWIWRDGAAHETWQTLPAARLLTRYRRLFPVPPRAPTEFQPGAKPPQRPKDPLDPGTFLVQWQYTRQRQIGDLREQAARRAAGRSALGAAFGRVPTGLNAFEWRCCVLQELVIRGRDHSAVRAVGTHITAMRERRHPLAWLPLRLLPVESELGPYLVQFGPAGSYGHAGTDPVPAGRIPAASTAPGPSVVAVSNPPQSSEAGAAIRSWQIGSNGMLEVAEFRLDRPLMTEHVGADWFAALPVQSVTPTPQRRLTVSHVPPSYALGVLFSAAQSGGAYPPGDFGAYGRLHAWQSFGWLAGVEPGADAETVAEVAAGCAWFAFGGTDWFFEIAWDLGLICVRPDRLSVALLAASDTD